MQLVRLLTKIGWMDLLKNVNSIAVLIETLKFFSFSLITHCSAASAAPEDVRVSVLNSTAIFVEWGRIEICRAANGRIVKYTVRYRIEPDGLVESVDRPGNRSGGENVSISGLTPFTVYSVQVAAVNENGLVGVFSNPKIVQTEEDGKSLRALASVFFLQFLSLSLLFYVIFNHCFSYLFSTAFSL